METAKRVERIGKRSVDSAKKEAATYRLWDTDHWSTRLRSFMDQCSRTPAQPLIFEMFSGGA